jgi:hypothetical protein
MSGTGSAMRGNATTSWRVERRQHMKRMSCKGGATRDNTTTSWLVERRQRIERRVAKVV